MGKNMGRGAPPVKYAKAGYQQSGMKVGQKVAGNTSSITKSPKQNVSGPQCGRTLNNMYKT